MRFILPQRKWYHWKIINQLLIKKNFWSIQLLIKKIANQNRQSCHPMTNSKWSWVICLEWLSLTLQRDTVVVSNFSFKSQVKWNVCISISNIRHYFIILNSSNKVKNSVRLSAKILTMCYVDANVSRRPDRVLETFHTHCLCTIRKCTPSV